MIKKFMKWFEEKKAVVAAKMSEEQGEMYVPTLVMVAGAVLLGFVLINIFDVLFGGVVKDGLTEAFTSIFANIKAIISSGSPVVPVT